jgi:pyruvate formate lyase activating enzyme
MIKPAEHWEALENDTVMCRLCPAECTLKADQYGNCQARVNRQGKLVTENYGELVTLAVDPIEKKPLYHFYPGRQILSTGPNCCNLGCLHCQNWSISQEKTRTVYQAPEMLVENAGMHGSIGIAFTYTEPLMWFEYLSDTAPLLREAGYKVVLVTNGFLNRKPLDELLPFVDAMNIDLKSMSDQFYRRICKGKLAPVQENIRAAFECKVHVEVTNLIIPGENDGEGELNELIDFVASISELIPLHFSAYRPEYKMDHEPTSPNTLLRAAELAKNRLKYVYLGNVMLPEGRNTYCPDCGNLLIERTGFQANVAGLSGRKCSGCGADTGIIND